MTVSVFGEPWRRVVADRDAIGWALCATVDAPPAPPVARRRPGPVFNLPRPAAPTYRGTPGGVRTCLLCCLPTVADRCVLCGV